LHDRLAPTIRYTLKNIPLKLFYTFAVFSSRHRASPAPAKVETSVATIDTRRKNKDGMAPATQEGNGMIHGENASRLPSLKIEERRSCASDSPEPADSDTGEHLPGTKDKFSHLEETIDEDEDGPFADREEDVTTTGDDSVSIDGETNTLEGTTYNKFLPKDAASGEYGNGAHANNDEDGAKRTQENDSNSEEEASDNDPGELSEGTKVKGPLAEDVAVNDAHSNNQKDAAGERPVRQKLKETSIAGVARAKSPIENAIPSVNSADDYSMASQESPLIPEDQMSEASSVDERGRSRRKRSFSDHKRDDDDYGTEKRDEEEDDRRRKRSRDSTAEDNVAVQERYLVSESRSDETYTKVQSSEYSQELGAEMTAKEGSEQILTEEPKHRDRDTVETILGPKKKRSRDQFDKDYVKVMDVSEEAQEADTVVHIEGCADNGKSLLATNRSVEGEPEKKRHRDNSQERDTKTESVAAETVGILATGARDKYMALTDVFIGLSLKSIFQRLYIISLCLLPLIKTHSDTPARYLHKGSSNYVFVSLRFVKLGSICWIRRITVWCSWTVHHYHFTFQAAFRGVASR
jgi:Ran-binding protein 3